MNATNPYQPAHLSPRQRRRSLVVIASAGLGSILALVVLNLVVQPSQPAPAIDIELTPAAPAAESNTTTVSVLPVSTAAPTSAPATTAAPTFVGTLGASPVTTIPSTTTPTKAPIARWIPPDTPDFVRLVLLDDESLDVVAPFANGTKAYFSVSRPGSAACGGTVYRVQQGQAREVVSSARFLFPRFDGRWFVLASARGDECRPGTLTIVDTVNDTARELLAAGWFYRWSTTDVRFVLYDYLVGTFTLYDGPSATSQRLSVAPSFAAELDERVGPRPADRPGWVMGRVAFLDSGEFVAHIQCLPDACPKKDSISGWFYVVDGQVTGEAQRVPDDKAPPLSFYCGV
ncbi:MAG: hypothetical protein ABIQ73_23325 [Acidimicrobiales bacterium]